MPIQDPDAPGGSPVPCLTRQEFESQVIAQSWKNPDYKDLLLTNPCRALAMLLESPLSRDCRVQVVEERPGEIYLVLPKRPPGASALTDSDLLAFASNQIEIPYAAAPAVGSSLHSFPIPHRHQVAPERASDWVITCADEPVYEELLVPFLGSLISLAQWNGQIVVFDYGLNPSQARRLTEFGVTVEPVPHKHFVNLDRFLHLASFAERHSGVMAQWDADVWFTDTVFELFDDYSRGREPRIVCNLDRVFQQSCYWVARQDPEIIQRVRETLEPIIEEHGNVLQCGFLIGASQTVARFCRYLESLIDQGEYHPEWNSDTVGLNFFYRLHRDLIHIIDHRYNCLPDWGPERRGSHFFHDGRQMRVMHVTSPWRRVPEGDSYRFQHVHPELYEQWRRHLGG